MRVKSVPLIVASGLLVCVAADVYALWAGVDQKLIWMFLSLAITMAGYSLYISQMYPPKGVGVVKPHPLSWGMFGFLTAVGCIVQYSQGGGIAGSACLGVTALACFIIAFLSYRRFSWTFSRWSKISVGLSFLLFVASIWARSTPNLAVVAAILATLADLWSYQPTFAKAWWRPHEDSPTNFAFNSVKCIPQLLAEPFPLTIATSLYLLMLTFVNGGFAIFLLIRRRQVPLAGEERATLA